MKKIMGLCLIGVIITIAFYPVTGGTFQEKPLINHTGYTLRQGGLLITCCWFQILSGKSRFVPGVKYGVTNNFQLEIHTELRDFFPHIFLTEISGKYHLIQIPAPRLNLAISLDWSRTGLIENKHISEIRNYLHGEIATTLDINKDIHFNAEIGNSIYLNELTLLSPSGFISSDVNIFPNIKLISAFSFPPSGLSIQMLTRFFHILDLFVGFHKYLYIDNLEIGGYIQLRF